MRHHGGMKAYSEDLRRKVVEAVEQRGMGKSEAARSFGVSLSSVKRYVGKARQGSSLSPIAVCSNIGPLLLAKSGVDVSGILKPPALCLKANTAGVAQLH